MSRGQRQTFHQLIHYEVELVKHLRRRTIVNAGDKGLLTPYAKYWMLPTRAGTTLNIAPTTTRGADDCHGMVETSNWYDRGNEVWHTNAVNKSTLVARCLGCWDSFVRVSVLLSLARVHCTIPRPRTDAETE